MKQLSIMCLGGMFALAACAGPTAYQPKNDNGFGYSQQQLESDRYRVDFTGNSATPRDVVEEYLLYRAADLTVQTGHDYFVIANSDTDKNTQYNGFVEPAFGPRFGGFYGYPGWYGGTAVTEMPSNQYDSSAVIIVGNGPIPKDKNAYDAHDVLRTIGPNVKFPQSSD